MPFKTEKHHFKPQAYQHLFNNESFADVKFIFRQSSDPKPKILYSHSFVLSAASSKFYKLFACPNQPKLHKFNNFYELIITGATYSNFCEFINYFYNLDTIKPQNRNRTNNLYSLLKLANDYNVVVLENLILSYFDKHLKSNVNFNTVLNTLLISNFRCDKYRKTFAKSVAFIKRNSYKFLSLNLVHELDQEGLEIFLRFNEVDLWTKEIDIYQAVIGWAEKQNKFDRHSGNYREVVGEKLIKLIRFPTMSDAQFRDVIAGDATKLLQDYEIRRLISYISNTSFAQDNEIVDLCGYDHVVRKRVKPSIDYTFC